MNENNDVVRSDKGQSIEHQSEGFSLEQWTYKGKPLRILSTSLGIVLVANMLFTPAVYGETATPTPSPSSATQPKLTEWSSEAVKKYYDPNVDWNIPLPANDSKDQSQTSGSTETNTNGNSNSTVIVNNGGGGFGGIGFTELLLFHMMFNRGGSYSSSQWYDRRPVFDPGTSRPYQAKSFNSDTFQNRPTAGSSVRPSTSQKSGTFSTKSSSSTKSTSSAKGGIGGNSSGFSSSSKSSGGSSSGG
jgi:hypothetical protein